MDLYMKDTVVNTVSAVLRHGPKGPGPEALKIEGLQIYINYIIYKIS